MVVRKCWLVAALLLVPVGPLAMLPAFCLAATTGNILIGDMSASFGRGILLKWLAKDLSGVLKTKMENVGHTIVRDDDGTRADALAAARMNDARILVIFGHGTENVWPPPDYVPIIIMTGGEDAADTFSPTDFMPGEVFNTYQHVVFYSCGQFLDAWSNRFSGQFVSWAGSTNIVLIDSDVGSRKWNAPPAGPSDGSAALAAWEDEGVALPGLVPQLVPHCPPAIDDSSYVAEIGMPDNPLFRLSEPLRTEFGSRTFNVWGVDSTLTNFNLYYGAEVWGGQVEDWDPAGYGDTDFDIAFTDPALWAAFTVDPLTVYAAYDAGEVFVFNNLTGLPDTTLFRGVAATMFGLDATDVTECDTSGWEDDAGPTVTGACTIGHPWPNPARNHMRIPVDVSRPTWLRAEVYNTLGQQVRMLMDEHAPVGPELIRWDGRSKEGTRVPRGVYFVRIRDGNAATLRRVVLR